MKTWIALLRGINVGGHHIVPMKELKALMEADGFAEVKTYIQSGNVVFKFPTHPKNRIGELIESRFGFLPESFILSQADLKKAIAANPYETDIGKEVHFFFCDKVPAAVDFEFLEQHRVASESYKLVGNVFYLHTPDGIGRSKLAEKMGRAFKGVSMTARNLNTIRKLVSMCG